MDQDTARVLFREGAVLILHEVPEGTEFGIDYHSWTVGPKFRGIKMIPPGVHFVYYRYQGRATEMRIYPFIFNSMRIFKISGGIFTPYNFCNAEKGRFYCV